MSRGTTLRKVTFEDAVKHMTDALKNEGCGILTEINVRDTLEDPKAMFRLVDNAAIAPVAEEAEERLRHRCGREEGAGLMQVGMCELREPAPFGPLQDDPALPP